MSLPPQDKSAKTLAQVHQKFIFFLIENLQPSANHQRSFAFILYFLIEKSLTIIAHFCPYMFQWLPTAASWLRLPWWPPSCGWPHPPQPPTTITATTTTTTNATANALEGEGWADILWVSTGDRKGKVGSKRNSNSKRFRRRRMGGHSMGFHRRQQREGREPRFLNSVDSISSFLCGFLLDLIENSFE